MCSMRAHMFVSSSLLLLRFNFKSRERTLGIKCKFHQGCWKYVINFYPSNVAFAMDPSVNIDLVYNWHHLYHRLGLSITVFLWATLIHTFPLLTYSHLKVSRIRSYVVLTNGRLVKSPLASQVEKKNSTAQLNQRITHLLNYNGAP